MPHDEDAESNVETLLYGLERVIKRLYRHGQEAEAARHKESLAAIHKLDQSVRDLLAELRAPHIEVIAGTPRDKRS